MVNIAENVLFIREQIKLAAEKSGRKASEIKLMGVSKFHPFKAMEEASKYVDLLGENRVQEAYEKRGLWKSENKTPWHLIGSLQRNKARKALEIFDLIESVDTLELAMTLDRILQETERTVFPVYIEINVSGEASKSGIRPADAPRLLENIMERCGRLKVEGLMTIGPNTSEEAAVRKSFAMLREMRDKLKADLGLPLPELSMGMSGDFETAIEEGSTAVRIGTAIFGEREYVK